MIDCVLLSEKFLNLRKLQQFVINRIYCCGSISHYNRVDLIPLLAFAGELKVYGVHNYGKHLNRDLSMTQRGSREGEGAIDRLSWNTAAAYTHETNNDCTLTVW